MTGRFDDLRTDELDDDHADNEPSTWLPVDLTDALNGVDVPPPTIMARTDKINLLYAGRTHGFAGESESLKSWAAQVAVVQQINAGANVLWIDFEDDAKGVVARLLSMMCSHDTIRERFTYVRPEEALRTKNGAWTAGGIDFDLLLATKQWALVVIDGVTEALVTEGFNLIDNGDIAEWSRILPKRCAKVGAAVVMIDHVPKSNDNRGRYAIGGQHKLAGLTGCQYIFEVERKFSRAISESITGVVKITVTKDRPGHVRTYARDDVVARLHLTSYPDGGVSASIERPDDSSAPLNLAAAINIYEQLVIYPQSSKKAIETAVGGKTAVIRQTLTAMVTAGWVVVERQGKGLGHFHSLTPEGIKYFAP